MFWYWSLSCSVFSLISSTIDQLLECLSGLDDEIVSESDHAAILSLFVHTKASSLGLESHSPSQRRKPNWLMIYV